MMQLLYGCAKRLDCNDDICASIETSSMPPKQCYLDGCTLVPDFDFKACCNKHDALYWKGGVLAKRKIADLEFRQCIIDLNRPWLAELYYIGVRLGGTSFLPTPWRWGFGWYYPNYSGMSANSN